jgi:quinol monooxygenase YgiN
VITFTARIRAISGKEEEAKARLREMVEAVEENEPGALAYILHEVDDQPGEFLFYEVYRDEAAREAHDKTPHFENLINLFGEVLDPDYKVSIEHLDRVAGFWR